MASNIFSAEKDALKNTGKLNLLQHKFVLERFSAFWKNWSVTIDDFMTKQIVLFIYTKLLHKYIGLSFK